MVQVFRGEHSLRRGDSGGKHIRHIVGEEFHIYQNSSWTLTTTLFGWQLQMDVLRGDRSYLALLKRHSILFQQILNLGGCILVLRHCWLQSIDSIISIKTLLDIADSYSMRWYLPISSHQIYTKTRCISLSQTKTPLIKSRSNSLAFIQIAKI